MVWYLSCVWHTKWTMNASGEFHPKLFICQPQNLCYFTLIPFSKVLSIPMASDCSVGFHLESHHWCLLLPDPLWHRNPFKYDKSCPRGHTSLFIVRILCRAHVPGVIAWIKINTYHPVFTLLSPLSPKAENSTRSPEDIIQLCSIPPFLLAISQELMALTHYRFSLGVFILGLLRRNRAILTWSRIL